MLSIFKSTQKYQNWYDFWLLFTQSSSPLHYYSTSFIHSLRIIISFDKILIIFLFLTEWGLISLLILYMMKEERKNYNINKTHDDGRTIGRPETIEGYMTLFVHYIFNSSTIFFLFCLNCILFYEIKIFDQLYHPIRHWLIYGSGRSGMKKKIMFVIIIQQQN